MPDIIQLLPDSVANQIAAGEVVQRPASVVKELLENAIDAEATQIQLNIKNAGKNLVQVIDNGVGMTETDARLCIERHATSKITKVEDLFSLNTLGFRGEALPSIAAVARLNIKSKKAENELGTSLTVEGSKVQAQEICQCPKGSNISVKSLFFNIPARRNFLKSNSVETKHIMEEFLRVALIRAEIKMSLSNEGKEVYQLPKSNFRQRIVNIFGKKYNQRLVPVEESTDIVSISGFIGKPEFAKKSRGEQYLFVNQRFIRSPYLHHAIQNAFEGLLSKDQFPSYFLQLSIDPAKIDINIHPTKTEIKFEEERSIYAIIRTSVRQSLGKFNVAPSLDFEQESGIEPPLLKKGQAIQVPGIQVDPNYNPFEKKKENSQEKIRFPFKRENQPTADWEKLYSDIPQQKEEIKQSDKINRDEQNETVIEAPRLFQLHGKYLVSHIKTGFIIVHQERAHQRILIEKLENQIKDKFTESQQLLFPQDIKLSAKETLTMNELLPNLKQIGFDIRPFGENLFLIHGVPAMAAKSDLQSVIEGLIEEFQQTEMEVKGRHREKIIQALAKKLSIKVGKPLTEGEMLNLIDELFACKMPYHLPNGLPILIQQSMENLDKQFKKK